MPTIPLIFQVSGDTTAERAFGSVGAAGKKMGADVGGAGTRARDANGRFIASTNRARDANGRFTKSTTDAGRATGTTGGRFRAGAAAATAMAGSLASIGLRTFSNNLISAGDEAEAANLKLAAMLAVRGQSAALPQLQNMATEMSALTGIDDDKIANIGARLLSFGLTAKQVSGIMPGLAGQAKTMDQDLGSVADAFGRAYASGNPGALKRSGVVLEQASLDRIKALKKEGKYAEATALTYSMVKDSFDRYAIGAGKGISSSQLQRARFAVQMGNVQETMGQGAGQFRAGYQGALAPILGGLAQNQPGVLKAAGAAVEAGSVVAPIFTVMATIGQAMPAFNSLGNAIGTAGRWTRSLGTAANFLGNTQLIAAGRTRIAAFWTTAFGNAGLVSAARLRLASATTGNALGSVGIALGALAAVAWSIQDIAQSSKDATLGDVAYEKKRGERGKIENRVGKFLANIWTRPEQARGRSLDAQIEAENKKAAQRRARGHTAAQQATLTQAKKHTAAVARTFGGTRSATGAGIGGDIESLQDQIAARRMAKSKDPEGAALQEELRLMRRQEAHKKEQEADAKRAASDAKKKQRLTAAAQRESMIARMAALPAQGSKAIQDQLAAIRIATAKNPALARLQNQLRLAKMEEAGQRKIESEQRKQAKAAERLQKSLWKQAGLTSRRSNSSLNNLAQQAQVMLRSGDAYAAIEAETLAKRFNPYAQAKAPDRTIYAGRVQRERTASGTLRVQFASLEVNDPLREALKGY